MSVAGAVTPAKVKQSRPAETRRENQWFAPLVVFVVVFAVWEALVRALQVPVFLLPAPSAILSTFLANAGELLLYGFNTFRQAFLGFAIGCGLGILVAMITARSPLLSDLLVPLAVASNSVPIVAMAPLAIVWFGIGEGSKIAIVAIMCFFPTLVSAVRGLLAASPAEVELLRSYAASEWETFRKLRVPTALPYIFNAFKICSTLSMIGAIVAEFFGGSVKYLGVYIKTEANILHTTEAWAAIVVACLIGIAFYLAIVAVERMVMPWHVSQRGDER
jgi:NitT/TauT family transport system permease protein